MTRLPQEDSGALSGLSDEALKGLFSELHGRPAPRFIRRRILLLAVGFALQEADLFEVLLERSDHHGVPEHRASSCYAV